MFKIGDWIRIENLDPFTGTFRILSEHTIIDDVCCYDVGFEIKIPIQYLTLWQPKQGEWCWFDKNKLGKFWKKQGSRYYWTLSEFKQISEKTSIPNGDYFVSDYCEPFIGKLPICLQH